MNYKLRLNDRVLSDVATARRWYDRKVPGLGHRFETEFYAALKLVAGQPMTCAPLLVVAGMRHQFIESFPYAIYFRVMADDVWVLLVFHGARDPKSLSRLLRGSISP